MRDLNGKVAVITGAGSGIGQALALALADEGCQVAICDIDRKGLERTAGLIESKPVECSIHTVDVADRDLVQEFAANVLLKYGHVDILINNAGVVIADTLEDVSYADFDWLMAINFWGVVHCAKAFLPLLKLRPEAHIVNISSIDGVLATPNNGPYCAAKFAVTGLTETLSQELQNTNVRVSCVFPGGVKTNIHRNARFVKMANPNLCHEDTIACLEKMSPLCPEAAAAIIIKGIQRNKTRILVGRDAWLLDILKRLMPVWTTRIAAYFMRNLDMSKTKWLP
jgi:NAD(P)-dependent dehydrogenase (short-subunit alcohol dehydrogenase family)